MRNRKAKTFVYYCQCDWILLKETLFYPKLEITFCNTWLSEPNIGDQTQLSFILSYVFSFLAGMLFTKRRNESRTWSQVTEPSKGLAVCRTQKRPLHKLYNYDILVSFAAFIRVVTQAPPHYYISREERCVTTLITAVNETSDIPLRRPGNSSRETD